MRNSRKIIRHGSHWAHTNCHISPITQIAPSINPSLYSDCTTMFPIYLVQISLTRAIFVN